METACLKVTSKVIEQMEKAVNQEQIAISCPSSLLAREIAHANKNNLLSIRLANAITLKIGDTGAIWRVQNKGNEKVFDALFRFLAENPDQNFEFICSIIL